MSELYGFIFMAVMMLILIAYNYWLLKKLDRMDRDKLDRHEARINPNGDISRPVRIDRHGPERSLNGKIPTKFHSDLSAAEHEAAELNRRN